MTAFPNTLYSRAGAMLAAAAKTANAAHQRLNTLGSQLSQTNTQLSATNTQLSATNTNVTALQPGAWSPIILENSWVNVTGSVAAQVRLLTSATAQIIGNIESGTVTDGTIIGVLPSGFYNTVNAHILSAATIPGAEAGSIELSIAGVLTITGFNSAVTQISFSDILPLSA